MRYVLYGDVEEGSVPTGHFGGGGHFGRREKVKQDVLRTKTMYGTNLFLSVSLIINLHILYI